METDSAFTATPLVGPPTTCSTTDQSEASPSKTNTTFIQNQISVQRSPSTVKDHASALSRALSVKSNGSHENPQPAISALLISTPEATQRDVYQETRGREQTERGDSDASIVDSTNKCTLSKSSSERSNKSVRSMQAIGTHSFGTLRVHSPSPTRAPNIKGLEFLKSGDVVVVRDIPVGVVFGYDTISLTIKKQGVFEGVKNLDPGAHFVWAGTRDGSLRTGFWLMSSKLASDEYGEVIVKTWDKYNEVLVDEVSVAEIRIQEKSLPEFANNLQDYHVIHNINGINDPTIWTRLTSSMKAALLNRVTGQKEWNHWQVSSNHDYKISNGVHGANTREYDKDEILDFVFPKDGRTFSNTSVGRERTEQALDTSAHIHAIITGHCTHEDSDEIVGELQFCYLTGMMLGNIACIEHWAHIVKVMFRAFRLVMDMPALFRKFIQAVHAQFLYDGVGIEGSILDADGGLEDELKNILTVFKSRLDEQLLQAQTRLTPEQKSVGDAFAELESFLWKWRGGWDLRGNYVRSGQVQLEDGEYVDAELKDFEAEDERGEFAPTVVQLDDEGREIGLVRF
ncbi:hypothetical protein ONS96_007819 [Cadophora gregata f. sp. sojae]|nr:hypothetical protein ONS96_007819 [Cadophora gregata f. sp. sojae]